MSGSPAIWNIHYGCYYNIRMSNTHISCCWCFSPGVDNHKKALIFIHVHVMFQVNRIQLCFMDAINYFHSQQFSANTVIYCECMYMYGGNSLLLYADDFSWLCLRRILVYALSTITIAVSPTKYVHDSCLLRCSCISNLGRFIRFDYQYPSKILYRYRSSKSAMSQRSVIMVCPVSFPI